MGGQSFTPDEPPTRGLPVGPGRETAPETPRQWTRVGPPDSTMTLTLAKEKNEDEHVRPSH